MIACPRGGDVYTIATTRDALKFLTTAWPVAQGRAFAAAKVACEALPRSRRRRENRIRIYRRCDAIRANSSDPK
ncbi:DUF982 domain-containing protein [Rhizobium sp. Root1203]|uniref:DUF982 domain-containing protein n=1 Tax=Rhizobium sp. Root1203 TaxID=1736427 RepID=UPI003FD68A42